MELNLEIKCIYCNHKIVYTLSNGHIKCSKCHKKYSPKKYQLQIDIIGGFCNDYNALELSKKLKINYITIAKHYQRIRSLIVEFCQDEFQRHEKHISEYDEYLYLPNNKKYDVSYIYEGENFLIFDYGKIYTLQLPFSSKYSQLYTNPKDFKQFLQYNKIAKLKTHENNIKHFISFFEKHIKKHKGISKENFIYYLKEFEFKFNYKINQRADILIKLMYASISK